LINFPYEGATGLQIMEMVVSSTWQEDKTRSLGLTLKTDTSIGQHGHEKINALVYHVLLAVQS
jgi:hypothetical protein